MNLVSLQRLKMKILNVFKGNKKWDEHLKIISPLREKCPNTELFLVRIFTHSDWIRRDTKYLSVFSLNAGKYEPEITPYLETFSRSAQGVNWTYIRPSEDVQDGVCKSIAARYQNTWIVNNEITTIIFTRGVTDGDWFLRKMWLPGDFLGFLPTKKLGINVYI